MFDFINEREGIGNLPLIFILEFNYCYIFQRIVFVPCLIDFFENLTYVLFSSFWSKFGDVFVYDVSSIAYNLKNYKVGAEY